jgi:predicted metal-dependent enzyme (double-stranded beta helix superfamily)
MWCLSTQEDRVTKPDEPEWPPHLDALIAAPANHHLLHEDDEVRVLEVTVQPGERENLHHHRWPSIMVVLARPNYRNFDGDGNEIPPSGGTPASPVLPRALRLPPQRLHAIEVAADALYAFQGIRVEFKTPEA